MSGKIYHQTFEEKESRVVAMTPEDEQAFQEFQDAVRDLGSMIAEEFHVEAALGWLNTAVLRVTNRFK